MSNEDDCKDGACAIDYTQEVKPKEEVSFNKEYIIPGISLVFLLIGIALDFFEVSFFKAPIPVIWFGILYIVVGGPIVLKALKLIVKGDVYNEFVLMSVATLVAFAIGSYEEGVAVMMFYVVGELFQEAAVNKAKRSIEALLKVQVEEVTVLENRNPVVKHPREVEIGQIFQVKPGQKIALDGELISEYPLNRVFLPSYRTKLRFHWRLHVLFCQFGEHKFQEYWANHSLLPTPNH